VRTIAVVLSCLLLASPALAQSAPTPQERYERQKKSAALALTLEALCPLAGAGALYARDTDKAAVLGILSLVALGAAAGSVLALVHLDNERGGGVDRAFGDAERAGAVTLLITAAVSYVVLRISGLALAPQASSSFNLKLRDQLGVPPETLFHSFASGMTLTLPF
jgi:hypothetical protein